ASRPFPMNCAINTSTRSSVWPETMYRVKKIPRRAAITAAITAVALSDILSPRATLFLRGRAHIAPRIGFLLLDVRQSAHRGLVGVVGILLKGPFLLNLRLFFIAHAGGPPTILPLGPFCLPHDP